MEMVKLNMLKQALNHGLVLKKVHKVIKYNQNSFLKPYIDMKILIKEKIKKSFN